MSVRRLRGRYGGGKGRATERQGRGEARCLRCRGKGGVAKLSAEERRR